MAGDVREFGVYGERDCGVEGGAGLESGGGDGDRTEPKDSQPGSGVL